jgi:hypothetical protein
MDTSLSRLVRMLCGGFSNQAQAFDNPPLFAHILVQCRPLPQLEPGSLLLEQSYAITPGVPYRIRVLRPERREGELIIHNQAFHDERSYWGATEDESLRSRISGTDLRPLEGCTYEVREQGEGFEGEVEPGCRCLVERKGTTAYLVSRFELDPAGMRTIDRGHDPTTHEQLWGSQAGAFAFERTHDFSGEIPPSWLAALAG